MDALKRNRSLRQWVRNSRASQRRGSDADTPQPEETAAERYVGQVIDQGFGSLNTLVLRKALHNRRARAHAVLSEPPERNKVAVLPGPSNGNTTADNELTGDQSWRGVKSRRRHHIQRMRKSEQAQSSSENAAKRRMRLDEERSDSTANSMDVDDIPQRPPGLPRKPRRLWRCLHKLYVREQPDTNAPVARGGEGLLFLEIGDIFRERRRRHTKDHTWIQHDRGWSMIEDRAKRHVNAELLTPTKHSVPPAILPSALDEPFPVLNDTSSKEVARSHRQTHLLKQPGTSPAANPHRPAQRPLRQSGAITMPDFPDAESKQSIDLIPYVSRKRPLFQQKHPSRVFIPRDNSVHRRVSEVVPMETSDVSFSADVPKSSDHKEVAASNGNETAVDVNVEPPSAPSSTDAEPSITFPSAVSSTESLCEAASDSEDDSDMERELNQRHGTSSLSALKDLYCMDDEVDMTDGTLAELPERPASRRGQASPEAAPAVTFATKEAKGGLRGFASLLRRLHRSGT